MPTLTKPSRSATIALTVIVAAQLMFVLDATVVNIALVPISSALHFSRANLAWVVDAYSLAFGGLLLLGGRLGDVFGRRRLLIIGLTVFTLSSLLGGLASTSAELLLARALQGVGAAMAAPSTLSLITSIYEEGPARNRALGVFTAVSAGGGSLGLLLGGALTSWVSWRWVLMINVPIGALVVALAPRFVPEPRRNGGRLDVAGALLVTAGIGSIIYGFIRIAERAALSDTVVLFALGVVLIAGFVRVEQRTPRPLFPLRLLNERTRAGAYGAMFLLPATMYGVFFFVSQYLESSLHFSAIRTGFAFLPLTAMIFTMSRITPKVVSRYGARRPLLMGLTLVSIASFWIASGLNHGDYFSGLLGPLLLFGLGAGASFLPISATILSGVPHTDAGAASGMLQTMQQSGGALGVAALSSVAEAHGRSSALFVGGFVALVALGVAVSVIRPRTPDHSPNAQELAEEFEALPLFE
jgi:EmrB/QacA subfamily drug resistance transporter